MVVSYSEKNGWRTNVTPCQRGSSKTLKWNWKRCNRSLLSGCKICHRPSKQSSFLSRLPSPQNHPVNLQWPQLKRVEQMRRLLDHCDPRMTKKDNKIRKQTNMQFTSKKSRFINKTISRQNQWNEVYEISRIRSIEAVTLQDRWIECQMRWLWKASSVTLTSHKTFRGHSSCFGTLKVSEIKLPLWVPP